MGQVWAVHQSAERFYKIFETRGFEMSKYGRGRDDGTFGMGMGAAVLAIMAFCAGYTVRDKGVIFGATQTQTQQELQTK